MRVSPHVQPLLATAALLLTSCQAPEEEPPAPPPVARQGHAERRGLGLLLPLEEGPEAQGGRPGGAVEARRSLAVTEQAILERFGFEELMGRLAGQSGVPGLTALELYQQWWDTQRPAAAGLGQGGAHCDDERLEDGSPGFNGYKYGCPRVEGNQADENPFSGGQPAYIPVGLFNRFDLAAVDGGDCGEYRIVYARHPSVTPPNRRALIIFEGVLPNPRPRLGPWGCRPVARFWAELSEEPDARVRAERLHRFYFEGLEGFEPPMHIDNLGNAPAGRPTGQVRVNLFLQFPWNLREFQLRRECAGEDCTLRFVPQTVKDNPAGLLFSATLSHPRKAEFASAFAEQVASLAVNDVNRFSMDLDDRFNSGESLANGTDHSYVFHLGTRPSPLRARLQQELTALGSPLTPMDIVARAQALSCAGCHQNSNRANLGGGLRWPNKFPFSHVSESVIEEGPDGARYGLSEALTGTFLPHRQQVLEAFLDGRPPFCDPKAGPGPDEGRAPRCGQPRGPEARQ